MRRCPARPHLARRERRGATIVLVAFLGVALVGITAFAVDVSRMYVGANELQTVSDASALRGAQRLQENPGADPSSEIIAYALQNQALNGLVTVETSDIRPAIWTESSATLDSSGGVTWATANAVQVTARKTAGLLFGKVLRSVAPIPARRSAAWLANITGKKCNFMPFGFPIQNLFEDLGLGSINGRALTQAEINQVKDSLSTTSGRVNLTQILYPKENLTPTNETSIYWPLTPNMNAYADQISGLGGGCANSEVNEGQDQSPFTGNGGGASAKKVVDGVLGNPPASGVAICVRVADDATCYDPATNAPGITVTAAYTGGGTTLASCSGCTLPIRMVAGFRIVCVFYGNVASGANNPAERCPWLVDNFSSAYNKSYNTGTLVGYPVVEFELGSDVGLGNSKSLSQRLILVK